MNHWHVLNAIMNSIHREVHRKWMCSECICELVTLAIAAKHHSSGRKGNRRKQSNDQAQPQDLLSTYMSHRSERDSWSTVSLMYQSRVCHCLRPLMVHASRLVLVHCDDSLLLIQELLWKLVHVHSILNSIDTCCRHFCIIMNPKLV